MDWGSVPDWISALATVGATAAAVMAGMYGYKAYSMEVARDRHASEQQRRAQAEQVSGWAVVATEADPSTSAPVVRMQNLSPSPVYALRHGFSLEKEEQSVYTGFEGVLPPGSHPVDCALHGRGEDKWRQWAVRRLSQKSPGGIRPRVEITFQDAAGVCWLRDRNGTLSEITEAQAESRFSYRG